MNIKWRNLVALPTMQQRAARELQEAELDLLNAEAKLEEWTSARDIYRQRVARLRSLLQTES